ncbi:hypothetical protein ACFL5O_11645 [Myxococcota bacterium]
MPKLDAPGSIGIRGILGGSAQSLFGAGQCHYGGRGNTPLLDFFVFTVADWTYRDQRDVIDYLREENRILRAQFGGRRLRLTDDQRRRLTVRAKTLGRAALRGPTSIVTPDTLLGWYRKLVTAKYDGAPQRGPGHPPTASQIAELAVKMLPPARGGGGEGALGWRRTPDGESGPTAPDPLPSGALWSLRHRLCLQQSRGRSPGAAMSGPIA